MWLNLNTPPLELDVFEPNDIARTAANLNVSPFSLTRQLRQTHSALTIHESYNEDWFKWTAPENGELTVDLVFSHAAGDLDMNLHVLDGQLRELGRAISKTDNERITEPVTAGKTYYIQVFGHSDATQAAYDLILSGSKYCPMHGKVTRETIVSRPRPIWDRQINSSRD